jgi:hypothetical protein
MSVNDDDRWVGRLMDHARAETREESAAELAALRQQVQRLSDLLKSIKPYIDAMPEKKRRMVPGAAWIERALEDAQRVLDTAGGEG